MTEAYEAPRPRAKRAARGGSSGQARATSSGVSTRRFLLLAAALGLLVGVVLTWPLVLHLGSAVLEDGSLDAFQFTWNVWWVGESLLHLHHHPFATHYLYYPDGIPLLFHTGSFALGLLSLPLQLVAGVVVAHNVLVVTAPTLTLVAVALLAREATGDAWAALAAGLLGAITPYSVWALPVIYMSCGWIPPALLWLWWLLQRRREWRLVAATFALLPFSVFASQEYAMLSVALLGFDVAVRTVLAGRLGIPRIWIAGTVAFFALAGAFLGALALLALANPTQPPPLGQTVLASGFVLGFVIPPWAKTWPLPSVRVFFFGSVTLACAALGLCLAPRRATYWALAAVSFAAMVLGPHMYLRNPFFAFVVPDSGPSEPGIPGPYLLAGRLFPLLKFLRSPLRWMAGAIPALAVLAGVGVAALRARIARPVLRAAVTAAVLTLSAVVPVLESRGLGTSLEAATVPAAYDVVARDPTEAALLDLPSGYRLRGFASYASQYMFYQTAHRKFLLEGTVSRLPPGRTLVLARRIDDFAKLPWLKYVVVHRDLLAEASPPSLAQTTKLTALAQRQGRLVASDATTDVYQLDTFRPETVWSPRTPGVPDAAAGVQPRGLAYRRCVPLSLPHYDLLPNRSLATAGLPGLNDAWSTHDGIAG